MSDHLRLARQDRPIDDSAEDRLDREPFVESLVRALLVDDYDEDGELVRRRATGYVLGLTGRWGLGKTSILHLLANRLGAMDHVIVASFNPWLFKGRDELLSGFFNSLRSAMGRSKADEARALVGWLDRYWGAIDLAGRSGAALMDAYGGSGAATLGWRNWAPSFRRALWKSVPQTPDQERAALEKRIAESNQAIVVLIDELDRVEDDEVRAVAQLVKAVGDISGVSYLVAYDPDRVVQALGRGEGEQRVRTGELYLEKVIQHPIPLRPLFADDSRALLDATLADHHVVLAAPRDDHQRTILDHLVRSIGTPREIKRLVGAFSVLEKAVLGEICPYDVLGYCWILTKSSAVRESIAEHVDELVSDPSPYVLTKRSIYLQEHKQEPDVVDILGSNSQPQSDLLRILFPHLAGKERSYWKHDPLYDGNRLMKRRNLIRMLYLGNPPGMMRRTEIEEIWGIIDTNVLESRLRDLFLSNRVVSALDRLDDLLPLLPALGDKTFWIALSRALSRDSDWITEGEPNRSVVQAAAMVLYRFARRTPSCLPRFKVVVESLVQGGDYLFVPIILLRHLSSFALAIHKHVPPDDKNMMPPGDVILSKDETLDLLARELPRYESAVLDGSALRRLPTADVFYVIWRAGEWDNHLRYSLTEQISCLDALLTFATLFTLPHVRIDSVGLNDFVDIEAIRPIIDSISVDEERRRGPWIQRCVEELRIVVSEDDPQNT